eukprot:SAG22_NODE_10909_length_510_cov_1.090024_1_plen_59_part_10
MGILASNQAANVVCDGEQHAQQGGGALNEPAHGRARLCGSECRSTARRTKGNMNRGGGM